jgi:hypothetical protein
MKAACPRSAVGGDGVMAGKILGFLGLVSLAAVVASQWTDIVRYFKIEQLSAGAGHPGYVPVSGRPRYPQRPDSGDADGRGEFDSAHRGGPHREG